MKKAPFEFGITYVLNPNDGEKEIRAHLQNIREMGFTMIRTFLPWDGVEPADGIFEFGMFDSILSVERLERTGKEPLLLQIHYSIFRRMAAPPVSKQGRCLSRMVCRTEHLLRTQSAG